MRKYEISEIKLLLDTLRELPYPVAVIVLDNHIREKTPCEILGHRIHYLKANRIRKYLAVLNDLGIVRAIQTTRPYLYALTSDSSVCNNV